MGNTYDTKEKHPWWLIFVKIIFWIFTMGFILLIIGWYFDLSPSGKRKFWLVIVIFGLLSYAWQKLLDSPLLN